MEEIIKNIYEENNYPSLDKLYKLVKKDYDDIKKKDIKDYLSKQEEAQIFKETKQLKSNDGHITALQPNYSWQIDIYYMMKYYKQNHNYKYMFACIDVFTRKTYIVPMKTKEIDDVIKAIKLLFGEADAKPFIITSDSDSTFLSNECQKLFNKNEILHHTVPIGDHKSLGLIDRFARTLKTILHKRFIRTGTTNWVDALPAILKTYNSSPHVALNGIAPNQAETPENIYKIIDINIEKKNKKSTFKNPFNEGDTVRIEITGYNKKTEGKYEDKIYKIINVDGKYITLDNGQVKKYDMVSKVEHIPITPERVKKPNVIKKAKKEYEQEKILKREDQKQENIIEGKRERKRNTKYD